MARKLIINADDYGYVDHIDEAIIEAAAKGVVTSVSCFANIPVDILEAKIKKLKDAAPNVGIGLHFSITSGQPLSYCPSLMDGSNFKHSRDYNLGENLDELKTELTYQLSNLEHILGVENINHIDCHHNILYLDFGFFNCLLNLAATRNIPLRSPIRLDLVPQFEAVKKLNPGIVTPTAIEALKVRPRKNFFRLLYAVKESTVGFLADKIKLSRLQRSDYFALNIYGNANLDIFRVMYPLISENEVCEQIMHLSKPTNKNDRKNAPNGINPKYFDGRNEEFNLLMSDAFAAILIRERYKAMPLELVK